MSPAQQWGGGGGWGAPPPGGQPPPGGPPPGGQPPGDAPIGTISFSPADRTNISQTVLFMRIAGALAIASSVFGTGGGVAVGLYRGTEVAGAVCGGILGFLVQAALGAMLFVSANAFAKIVATDGSDQQHLASGLGQLRWYFLTKAILGGLLLIGFCLCIGAGIVFGFAMLAMLRGGVGP